MLPWLDTSARIVNRRCRFTRLRHALPAEDGPAANISINLAIIFTYVHRFLRGGDPGLQAWGGAAPSVGERKGKKKPGRLPTGLDDDRKMPTCGRAGPPKGWARVLPSRLPGRLRSQRIVGLGAASSGRD